jgi:hypothetical protein
MPRPLTLRWTFALFAAGLFAACSVGGCGARGTVRIESKISEAVLAPTPRLFAFRPSGESGADLLITDLTREQLDPGIPLDALEGNITHIHMFLYPRAGMTPIENTASTTTIRHVVLSRGAVGVYGGGGFLSPKGGTDDRFFGGRMREAPVVLTEATPDFHDPLGASSMSVDIRAPQDEALSRLILIRLGEALRRAEGSGDTDDDQTSP